MDDETNVKSRGITFGPESSDAIVFFTILQILCGNATDQRISRIAIRQQRTNGEQHFGDGQSGRPIVF